MSSNLWDAIRENIHDHALIKCADFAQGMIMERTTALTLPRHASGLLWMLHGSATCFFWQQRVRLQCS